MLLPPDRLDRVVAFPVLSRREETAVPVSSAAVDLEGPIQVGLLLLAVPPAITDRAAAGPTRTTRRRLPPVVLVLLASLSSQSISDGARLSQFSDSRSDLHGRRRDVEVGRHKVGCASYCRWPAFRRPTKVHRERHLYSQPDDAVLHH